MGADGTGHPKGERLQERGMEKRYLGEENESWKKGDAAGHPKKTPEIRRLVLGENTKAGANYSGESKVCRKGYGTGQGKNEQNNGGESRPEIGRGRRPRGKKKFT